MKKALKILMLEDSAIDAEIIQQSLLKSRSDYEFKLVMTEDDFLKELYQFGPDVIISDNTLPQFNATEALGIFNKQSLPIPFILVTGTVSEEFAAGIIKLGADDYILKDRLTRLPAAIDAALQKKKREADIKHSEEIRKLIMNSALDAIICIDKKGNVTVWNQQAEQMFGWNEEEIMGKQLADFIIPHPQRNAQGHGFNGYLESGESKLLNKLIELTALNKSGKEFPIELAIVHVQQDTADFFCAFIRDITERKKSEASLKLMEKKFLDQKIQEQKKISRAIIKAQEEEKNRIGQELHDNVNQILAGTKMYLSIAAKKNEAVKELVKYPIELIDSSIEEIRILSRTQVTPLKNINLEDLVQKLLANIDQNTIIQKNLTYTVADESLSDDLKLNMYRVIQEQISNILKHAEAKSIDISFKQANKAIHIIVADDGKGFNVNSKRKGIGISNMTNRVETYNGKITINSSPGNGCKIIIKIPC